MIKEEVNSMKEEGIIAYFSMEVGISHKIPTYAGGLGILAGDTLKSFADMGVKAVGITLLNEKGYFKQEIDDEGNQIEKPIEWDYKEKLIQTPNKVTVKIEGREVIIRAWKLIINGINGHKNPLYFLDTNIKENKEEDRELTKYLYGKDKEYRLKQEIILGIGGIKMLESLGYDNVRIYHMNEGHASLLTIELMKQEETGNETNDAIIKKIKQKCVFTTHTPIAAGHDKFEKELFKKILGDYVPKEIIEKATQEGKVNMTLIAMNNSKFVNGVAKRHEEITKKMFPNYEIHSITNGVHHITWTSKPFRELYDEEISEWKKDPYMLRYAKNIKTEKIIMAHEEAKKELIRIIKEETGEEFNKETFTIGFARRMTSYKRPELILRNTRRLKEIAEKHGEIQIIFSGKAHPQDLEGKKTIKKIISKIKKINEEEEGKKQGRIKIIFIKNYDMRIAKRLIAGCDAWLNNPQRPMEASGTSGMKAALNGVPQISTLDGWWLEGHIEGVTGWSIGPKPSEEGFENDYSPDDEEEDLYKKLEVIMPLYYNNKEEWARIMRSVIAINGSFFNSQRMVEQYLITAYD